MTVPAPNVIQFVAAAIATLMIWVVVVEINGDGRGLGGNGGDCGG